MWTINNAWKIIERATYHIESINKNIPIKKIIIIGVIVIAVVLTGIGIFIVKKIFKK